MELGERSNRAFEFKVADARIERSPQYASFYSNLAQVLAGELDLAVTFAEVVADGVIQEKCRVVMHPKQAEKLIEAIADALRNRMGLFEEVTETTVPSSSSEQ